MKSKKLNFEIFLAEKLSKNEQKSILGGDQSEIDPNKCTCSNGNP
jgi:natural product precursor